jgi:peptide/nickel transport system permease protein
MRVLPGDPALLLLSRDDQGMVGLQELQALQHRLGTDQPIIEQYARWILGVVRFDLGASLVTDRPVTEELWRRVPVTFQLATFATLLAATTAIPLGILMAVRRDTWVDYALRLMTLSALAVPHFVIGTVVILLYVSLLNRMPAVEYVGFLDDPSRNIGQLMWPVLIVAMGGIALIARMTRSTMLEVLYQDYVRTARGKGLAPRQVVVGHALRNALIPVFTLVGVAYVGALNGSVVIETMFGIPGVGSGLVMAIRTRDYPTVQGFILVLTIVVLTVNLLIDLAYSWLDPRITYAQAQRA